jgi:hypothetical protein
MCVTDGSVGLRGFASICRKTPADLLANTSRRTERNARPSGQVVPSRAPGHSPVSIICHNGSDRDPYRSLTTPIWSTHEQARPQAPLPQGQGRQPRPQAQRLSRALHQTQSPRSRQGVGVFCLFIPPGWARHGQHQCTRTPDQSPHRPEQGTPGAGSRHAQAGSWHAKGEVCRVLNTRNTSPVGWL